MNGATATSRPVRSPGHKISVSRILVLAVTAIVLAAMIKLLAVPSVVDRITVENSTKSSVTVNVTGHKRDGWMPVGLAPAGTATVFQRVIDQGQVWIFRFSGDGQQVELSVTQQQLEADQWRVQVPNNLAGAVGPSVPSLGPSPPSATGAG